MAENTGTTGTEGTETQTPPDEKQTLVDLAGKAPNGGDEWYLAEGVKGTDKRPEWLKSDKYKTVADQAKAYPDLEKKYGEVAGKLKGFVGAPEKYELSMPEDLKEVVEWSAEDPLLVEFQGFAKESGMSQEVFTKALHMLAKYEYTMEAIDLAAEKQAIGERADERLNHFTEWAQAHLAPEQFQEVVATLGKRPSPAKVFKAFEMILGATKQPGLPKPGEDVSTTGMTRDEWNSKWYAKSEVRGLQYKIDEPGMRDKARAELAQIVGSGDEQQVVNFRR